MKHPLISDIAAALSFTADAADMPRGSDLSGPWQLFVDDFLVELSEGVARSYHAFEKHPANPIQGITKYGGSGWMLPAEDGAGYRIWASGGTTGEQLIGNVDDLLVLGRALGSDDIRALANRGAAVFFRLNP